MKYLSIIFEIIGYSGFFVHLIMRYTHLTDNAFLLYASLVFIFLGGFFENLRSRKKIKRLELEIEKKQVELDKCLSVSSKNE